MFVALGGWMVSAAWASDVAGTWVYTNPMWGETISLEFRPDGTGRIDGEAVRYTRQGEQLVVELDGERLVYAVKVAGDQLTASGGDLEGTLVFARVGASPAPQPLAQAPVPIPLPAPVPVAPAPPPAPVGTASSAPGASPLVGTWTDGQGTITFRADGTCDYVGQSLRWTYDGTTLTLTGPGGVVPMQVRVDGDRFLATSNGETQTLTRAGSAQAPPAADAGGIAGVYVASEGRVDAQYAMSITQYLTLWPDGTVGWTKSELGASRTQVTDTLQRFSSFRTNPSAKGQTYGTWQATPDGVFIQWTIWNGLRCQGRLNPATGALTVTGMGILSEGATLTYERQR
jgi:hypothetical protein